MGFPALGFVVCWCFFFSSVPYKVMRDPGALRRRGMLGAGMRLALSVGGPFCSSPPCQ